MPSKQNARPKPPDGYETWLDWLVNLAALPRKWADEETPESISHCRAELADLRRDAAKWREHRAGQKSSGISVYHATTPAGDPLTYYKKEDSDAS